MADSQFIHLNTYSSTRPQLRNLKGKKIGTSERRWSASDVLDEATRKDNATPHIENPQVPKWHVGSRELIEQAGKSWAAVTTYASTKNVRKVRKDAPWLAAGVISFPRSRMKEWEKFRDKSIKWLSRTYGELLHGVVEHLDEEHPHLHFYLVPKPKNEFGTVHPGFAAKAATRRSGSNKVTTAYKEAMKVFQDEFHQKVASLFGLSRLGPARNRLRREVVKKKKAEEAALAATAKAEAELADLNERLRLADAKLNAATQQIEQADIDAQNSKQRAEQILASAKVQTEKLGAIEIARVRKKGADYLLAQRTRIRKEQSEANEAIEKIVTAYKILQSTSVFKELDGMRVEMDKMRRAIDLGEFEAARKFQQKARDLDPAKEVPHGWKPPTPKPW